MEKNFEDFENGKALASAILVKSDDDVDCKIIGEYPELVIMSGVLVADICNKSGKRSEAWGCRVLRLWRVLWTIGRIALKLW